MRPSAIQEELSFARETGTPVVIAGDQGVGKSSIVEQYAHNSGMDILLSHPVTWDPTDSKGLPVPDLANGVGRWLPYGDLLAAVTATAPTLWFLDDLGQAPGAVQASLMQIFLARRIGEHRISDLVQIIGATNRAKDRAGVGMPLSPLKGRVRIFQYDTSFDDWAKWAASNSVPPEIIGYLHFRPEHLHSCTPINDWQQDGATPRGWYRAGLRLKRGVPVAREIEVMAGDIGMAISTEFAAYMRVYRELPDLGEIEKSPEKAKVPEDLSAQYAVACALAHRATTATIGKHETYLNRIKEGAKTQREFRLLYWRQAVARDRGLVTTSEFHGFASDFKDVTLGA